MRNRMVLAAALLLAPVVAGMGMVGGAGTALAASLNDAEIAHIAYTAGAIDIKTAQLAEHKATNAKVVAFAREMERDHSAVNDKALALVKKLGVTPEANPTSAALEKQAAAEMAKLETLSGGAFDRAYIDNEVAYHKEVNDALRTTLIPDAKNGQLKALLRTGLALFEEHLMHAEHIAAMLQ